MSLFKKKSPKPNTLSQNNGQSNQGKPAPSKDANIREKMREHIIKVAQLSYTAPQAIVAGKVPVTWEDVLLLPDRKTREAYAYALGLQLAMATQDGKVETSQIAKLLSAFEKTDTEEGLLARIALATLNELCKSCVNENKIGKYQAIETLSTATGESFDAIRDYIDDTRKKDNLFGKIKWWNQQGRFHPVELLTQLIIFLNQEQHNGDVITIQNWIGIMEALGTQFTKRMIKKGFLPSDLHIVPPVVEPSSHTRNRIATQLQFLLAPENFKRIFGTGDPVAWRSRVPYNIDIVKEQATDALYHLLLSAAELDKKMESGLQNRAFLIKQYRKLIQNVLSDEHFDGHLDIFNTLVQGLYFLHGKRMYEYNVSHESAREVLEAYLNGSDEDNQERFASLLFQALKLRETKNVNRHGDDGCIIDIDLRYSDYDTSVLKAASEIVRLKDDLVLALSDIKMASRHPDSLPATIQPVNSLHINGANLLRNAMLNTGVVPEISCTPGMGMIRVDLCAIVHHLHDFHPKTAQALLRADKEEFPELARIMHRELLHTRDGGIVLNTQDVMAVVLRAFFNGKKLSDAFNEVNIPLQIYRPKSDTDTSDTSIDTITTENGQVGAEIPQRELYRLLFSEFEKNGPRQRFSISKNDLLREIPLNVHKQLLLDGLASCPPASLNLFPNLSQDTPEERIAFLSQVLEKIEQLKHECKYYLPKLSPLSSQITQQIRKLLDGISDDTDLTNDQQNILIEKVDKLHGKALRLGVGRMDICDTIAPYARRRHYPDEKHLYQNDDNIRYFNKNKPRVIKDSLEDLVQRILNGEKNIDYKYNNDLIYTAKKLNDNKDAQY